jgi:hypothetical protein
MQSEAYAAGSSSDLDVWCSRAVGEIRLDMGTDKEEERSHAKSTTVEKTLVEKIRGVLFMVQAIKSGMPYGTMQGPDEEHHEIRTCCTW